LTGKRIHLDQFGAATCGQPRAEVTAQPGLVTCKFCRQILAMCPRSSPPISELSLLNQTTRLQWLPCSLYGKPVWVMSDGDGRICLDDKGLSVVSYQPPPVKGAKLYSVWPANLVLP